MPSPVAEDDPDRQAASGGSGRPGFAWLAGSAATGPVPVGDGLLMGSDPAGGGLAAGRGCADATWPRGLDWQALVESLAAAGTGGDQEAVLAEEMDAEARGAMRPLPAGPLAALGAEQMTPGPAQAGWLGVAAGAAEVLDENALAGMAVAARRLAAWAQAAELTAVAQIAACAAAADPKIGVAADGRPERLCQDAVSQVSLALTLSGCSAGSWADLGVSVRWRLRATGQALAAGRIDLYRAKLIAEATSVLDEETARQVEAKILPVAGGLVAGELRARLRRAVIAADPEGAEQRRRRAERHAKVSLFGDDDGTAVLTGSKLPAIEAAAAMARITALARAMKAAGQAGGLDLHRAKVMLGLLLGTMPYIPPAGGAPPDQPPPDSNDPGGGQPGGGEPGGGEPGGPAGPDSDGADGTGRPPESMPGLGDGGPWDGRPGPRDEDAPDNDGLDDDGSDDDSLDDDGWDGENGVGEDDGGGLSGAGPVPEWPALGGIPPALARRAGVQPGSESAGSGRPVPGLLDVTLPWAVLAGLSSGPGTLGRIGPITAIQARQLTQAAEADPATQWRIIITNAAGHAIAITRIRRRRCPRDGPNPGRESPGQASEAPGLARDDPDAARDVPGQARDGPLPGAGLVGRVTLTISQDTITASQHAPGGTGRPAEPGGPGGLGPAGGIAAAAFQAAAAALAQALAQAEADEAAGGCAHQGESRAYRPPPRLRDYITARDVTCRFPPCRQPAWRADLDHTQPFDDGGRTCRCDLGGGCRRHHQLKQHPRWQLKQTRPGEFTWTAPSGRTYTTGPDAQPA